MLHVAEQHKIQFSSFDSTTQSQSKAQVMSGRVKKEVKHLFFHFLLRASVFMGLFRSLVDAFHRDSYFPSSFISRTYIR